MSILNIKLKEIKIQFKQKRVLAIMIIFPIVLMVILGTVFNDDSNGGAIEDFNVAYEFIGEGSITKATQSMMEDLSSTEDIIFTKVENQSEAMEDIKSVKYACFIVVNEDLKEIKIYENERFNFEASIMETIMSTFVQRYNTIVEIVKVNPQLLANLPEDIISNKKFVSINSVEPTRTASALDYYGVTMLTLIILYSSMSGAYATKSEKLKKTMDRMVIAPINKMNIFIGSTLGTVLSTIIQMIIVFSFSKYILKVYWGEHIVAVLLIILSLIIMSVSMGIAAGYIFKNDSAMDGFLNLLIPVMAFLGGAYTNVTGIDNKIFVLISKLSPVKWVNSTIFNIVYNNNFSDFGITIVINIGIAVLLMVISTISFNKEAS
jgi:ABC-2 type transport system permease protein